MENPVKDPLVEGSLPFCVYILSQVNKTSLDGFKYY